MPLISILVLTTLPALLRRMQGIGIPDPIIQGLFGIAALCVGVFIRRRYSWR